MIGEVRRVGKRVERGWITITGGGGAVVIIDIRSIESVLPVGTE
jgi:hypothetical protein